MVKLKLERPEAIRQSLISKWDQCPLTTRFELESELHQGGPLAARGVLFHEFAARALNHMRAYGETSISIDMAMELLTEVIAQRDVPEEDVVHLPMRDLRWLRVLVTKWAYQHEFDIQRVVAVERRLSADITVVGPGGTRYERTITGKPDVLLAGPGDDEATVLDWKSGFAPPAVKREAREGEPPIEDKLSDMGYVQQIVYGWLVLKRFPAIQRVTEREYYVMHGEVREATVTREEIERIEDVLAAVVSQLDAAVDSYDELLVRQEAARKARKPVPQGRFFAVPGAHCSFCPRPFDCPVSDEVHVPRNEREAQRVAQEWLVGAEIRSNRLPLLKGWFDAHGPIPIEHAKGRREVGWVETGTASPEVMAAAHERVRCSKCGAPVGRRCVRPSRDGYRPDAAPLKNPHYERWSKVADGASRRFVMYEPEGAPDSPLDPLLEEAARAAGVLLDD